MVTPSSPNGWSFLDYNSYFDTGYSTGDTSHYSTTPATLKFNVALVLDRAADPTALLAGDWGVRQKELASLSNSGTLWSTYGASNDAWKTVNDYLAANGYKTVERLAAEAGQTSGYVSGKAAQDARTIWVSLDQTQFSKLFGQQLLQVDSAATNPNGNLWWTGNLSLPAEISSLVKGIWFDGGPFSPVTVTAKASADFPALQPGFQGQGNGAGATALYPQAVAAYYNFPFTKLVDVPTAPIGLLEPGLGDASPGTASFASLLETYRVTAFGSPTVPAAKVIGVQPGGTYTGSSALANSERALDVGVATAVVPNSALVLYAGSGTAFNAQSDPFTADQYAIFAPGHPSVVSSSFHFGVIQPSPSSPWLWAAQQLFVDAALANMSKFNSSGDGGSGYEIGNGVANGANARNSPYSVVVGGTSLSTVAFAGADPTLKGIPGTFQDFYDHALQHDKATLWQLVGSGMTAMPVANASTWFAEAVWNRYVVANHTIQPGYTQNESGSGGVDFVQAEPWYQIASLPFDPPTTSDGSARTGRGVPDVSALSSGDMSYIVPNGDMVGTHGNGGTSAATPFWASLIVQVNAILHDQGVPYDLGYMTDLLYIAAAIAPSSFNDVTIGNNASSFYLVDPAHSPAPGEIYQTPSGKGSATLEAVVPSSFGYAAAAGYDLASGLGSPNGVLLARTLSTIVHEQLFFDYVPKVLKGSADAGWTSTINQSLLIQVETGKPSTIDMTLGSRSVAFAATGAESYGWTDALAGQSLQSRLDGDLVRLFDAAHQGTVKQATVLAGDALAVAIDGTSAQPYGQALTNAFGFVDFETAHGFVRLARPVAVAETAGGQDNQQAIVRLRQDGADDLSILFYKVNNLVGTILNDKGVFQPGSAGYAEAALQAAYKSTEGATWVKGPGFGQAAQAVLQGVNAGDVVAMALRNNSQGQTFWSFSQANEVAADGPVTHLRNYGANTWGWEDTVNGGDHDFNDIVVGIDFTSAAGKGYLV